MAGRIRCARPRAPRPGATGAERRRSGSGGCRPRTSPSTARSSAPSMARRSRTEPRRTAERIPDRDPHQHRDEHGGQRQLDGGWEPLEHAVERGALVDQRATEIAPEQVRRCSGAYWIGSGRSRPCCFRNRSRSSGVAVSGSRSWVGSSGHPDQQEHDQRDPEQGRDHLEQATTQVGQHLGRTGRGGRAPRPPAGSAAT